MNRVTTVILSSLCLLSGCTYNTEREMSSGTLGPGQEAIRQVSGTAEKDYFLFGIIQVGDDSLQAAMNDAINSIPLAQGLIGAATDRSCTATPLWPLFHSCQTTISGMAIKYLNTANQVTSYSENTNKNKDTVISIDSDKRPAVKEQIYAEPSVWDPVSQKWVEPKN